MSYEPGRDEHIGTVAVIDDDLSVRRALARLLRATGLSVDAYTSAEEFLAARNGHRYSLLLVDVTMPAMSGIDLVERLETEGDTERAVLITGHESRSLVERAASLGVPVLLKPIETAELLDAIGRELGRDLGGQAA